MSEPPSCVTERQEEKLKNNNRDLSMVRHQLTFLGYSVV